jgi:hypothetical protein
VRTGRRSYWFVIVPLWTSVIALALIAALKVTNPQRFVSPFDAFLRAAAAFAADTAPVFALTLVVTQALRPFVTSPAQFSAVHRILTGLRDHVVGPQTGAPYHFDRATLFRRYRFYLPLNPARWRRWPNSGWLVPVERSGETTKNRGSCFLAPDDADLAEGIAGQTWSQKSGIVFVPPPNDPPLPDLNEGSSDADIREYAKRSFVSEQWVRQWLAEHKRGLATRFVGIPVEIKSQTWGVIVLDLRSKAVQPLDQSTFRLIATCMSAVLGRGR